MSGLPDKGHCACKFSSGGVLSRSCEFHQRLLMAEREKNAAICEAMRPTGGRAWTEAQAACYEALSMAAVNIRAAGLMAAIREGTNEK